MLAALGLHNVWLCALDLQLTRADRIISLLVLVATGYGAASPGDGPCTRRCAQRSRSEPGGESLTR